MNFFTYSFFRAPGETWDYGMPSSFNAPFQPGGMQIEDHSYQNSDESFLNVEDLETKNEKSLFR